MYKILDLILSAIALALALFVVLPICAIWIGVTSIPTVFSVAHEFIRVIMENERKQKGGEG